MLALRVFSIVFLMLSAFGVQAELQPRLGGQAYYDTELDVTWLANAKLADEEDFGVPGVSGPGQMDWTTAHAWVAAMNAANYLGVNTWRLPDVAPINGVAFNTAWSENGSTDRARNLTAPGSAYPGSTASEMAHLYFNTLANISTLDVGGNPTACFAAPETCLENTGPFINMQPYRYWSGVAYVDPGYAWFFDFDGVQAESDTTLDRFVWPLFDGDPEAGNHNIAINIRPWADPNRIHVGSALLVPVAIYSTNVASGEISDFDATQVDPQTVRFGPDEAPMASLFFWRAPQPFVWDIDKDGDQDMLLFFRIRQTGIAAGDTSAVLTGKTYSGDAISGEDSVEPVVLNNASWRRHRHDQSCN